MPDIKNFQVTDQAGHRLDQFLSQRLTGYSRTEIKTWIKEGLVLVNQQPAKAAYKLVVNDQVQVSMPQPVSEEIKLIPQEMPLDIAYEDDDLIVVNKPQGLVVHPSMGHNQDSLVNGLLAYVANQGSQLADNTEAFRPGVVHRLDKDTSGLLLIAKTNQALTSLQQQIQAHSIERRYQGLVYGEVFDQQGLIDAPLARHPKDRTRFTVARDGRPARTHFNLLKRYQGFSLLDFRLETGRTHQIRVHSQFIGHPLVDDPTYARAYQPQFFDQQGQLLHAYGLSFDHPVTGRRLTVKAELPEHFQDILAQLVVKG
ncbi:ribosomal large subunit pseudouridine synthase D [Aerococcus urinaehominis]|uniref:Pseudouridine synthase n=1 Tax=Aerococcus urinaehominis TaxID=128944 RepID=A0A0X8FKN6_9LACT|nr:RluA family pseudouridine synthase [Aerococcus urinaehominis]AMB98839.1 ribosomal large subunit pseudouridine synthase D [Aerococcus urinaehominis]SDM17655.1 23S rRNA pseudouridine1911/1915/1917 synthase [Aerococcus urinaehominis]